MCTFLLAPGTLEYQSTTVCPLVHRPSSSTVTWRTVSYYCCGCEKRWKRQEGGGKELSNLCYQRREQCHQHGIGIAHDEGQSWGSGIVMDLSHTLKLHRNVSNKVFQVAILSFVYLFQRWLDPFTVPKGNWAWGLGGMGRVFYQSHLKEYSIVSSQLIIQVGVS